MNHRDITSIVLLAVMTATSACGASPDASPSATASRPTGPSAGGLTSVDARPSAVDVGALDVPLLDAAALPEGIPVPVPKGGTVDDSLSVFEGQSFVVEYPAAMFDTVATYYDAWFASEGIAVPPEFPAEGSRVWRPQVGGTAVQLELYPLTTGAIRLFITWP